MVIKNQGTHYISGNCFLSVTRETTVDFSSKLQKFDLIVIGSGSGLDVAVAAYQHGLRVAVIEN